jgi:hypothetical protein
LSDPSHSPVSEVGFCLILCSCLVFFFSCFVDRMLE